MTTSALRVLADVLPTQREKDAESGLMHYRARSYDPRLGRFVQRDPAGEGVLDYAYVANGPIDSRDPSGAVIEEAGIRDRSDLMEEVRRGLGRKKLEAVAFGAILAQVTKSRAVFEVFGNAWVLYTLGREVFDAGGTTDSDTNRFIYTARMGWIDVGHFFSAAMASYLLGRDRGYAAMLGYEMDQFHKLMHKRALGIAPDEWDLSAFSVEDLPSNRAGVGFGQRVAHGTPLLAHTGLTGEGVIATVLGPKRVGELLGKFGITSPNPFGADIDAINNAVEAIGDRLGPFNFVGAFDTFLRENEAVDLEHASPARRRYKKALLILGAKDIKRQTNYTDQPMFMKPEYHDELFPNRKAGSAPPVWP